MDLQTGFGVMNIIKSVKCFGMGMGIRTGIVTFKWTRIDLGRSPQCGAFCTGGLHSNLSDLLEDLKSGERLILGVTWPDTSFGFRGRRSGLCV